MVKLSPAVFLDRDGVLSIPSVRNNKTYAPREFKDFKLYPGVKKCISRLRKAGYKLIVVTNQPDIGNKLMKESELKKMHQKIYKDLLIDEIFVCVHKQDDQCDCRKPRPGMLYSAIKKYSIDINNSFLIGDRSSDIEAASKVKCKSIFIDREYKEKYPSTQKLTVNSLNEAVDYILG